MAKEMWIAGAIKKPGALHKELGVAEGRNIPKAKLEKAAKSKGVEGKRARLAETLEGFHHGKMKEREAGKKGDMKLHEMAEKRREKKGHHEKMMKHHEEKMMHHKEMMKDAMKKAGKKGDEKLHEMAVKRHEKKENKSKEMPKAKAKMKKVMHEFKEGVLRSGSKKGPEVTNPKQAVSIAYSEAKKASKKSKK